MTGGAGVLAAGTAALIGLVAALAAAATILGATTTGPYGASSAPSRAAEEDVPAAMLVLYQRAAATCPGLDWSVLAAVGKIETDHGRSTLPGVHTGENYAGAAGPMQFLAPTFAEVTAAHPPPPGGAQPPSRYDPHDAIYTAAAYLCDNGARTTAPSPSRPPPPDRPGTRRALFTYNRSQAYVADVLDQSATYRSPTTPAAASDPAGPRPPDTGHGGVALAYARGQLGLPYLWGGDGPQHGDAGFDCSGLTTAAWAAAGITLPRTADTQYRNTPPLPRGAALQPGDLLFFGTPGHVHHVGIATGQATTMIHAPRRGAAIGYADAAAMGDYLAAARPAPNRP